MKYFIGQIHSRPRKQQTVLCVAENDTQFITHFTAQGEMVDEYEEIELIDLTKKE